MRLEVEDPRRLGHLAIDLAAWNLGEPERESYVLAHGHVRVQRVALEDHRDASVLGCPVVDDLAADSELAVGDVFRPATIRSAVDLPEPDGPTRIMNSPSRTSR